MKTAKRTVAPPPHVVRCFRRCPLSRLSKLCEHRSTYCIGLGELPGGAGDRDPAHSRIQGPGPYRSRDRPAQLSEGSERSRAGLSERSWVPQVLRAATRDLTRVPRAARNTILVQSHLANYETKQESPDARNTNLSSPS
jgi:hypothetical protein